MSIGLNVKLLTQPSTIKRYILLALKKELNKKVYNNNNLQNLKKEVQRILRLSIELQPEYVSLKGGQLRDELGVADQDAIDRIINVWIRGVTLNYTEAKILGDSITGSITIEAVAQDYSDVLLSNASRFRTEKGEIVPWLEWILKRGVDIIIAKYDVKSSPDFTEFSRTGDTLMIASSGSWRVPPQFSGTDSNNFVTRAINDALKAIEQIFIQNIQKG